MLLLACAHALAQYHSVIFLPAFPNADCYSTLTISQVYKWWLPVMEGRRGGRIQVPLKANDWQSQLSNGPVLQLPPQSLLHQLTGGDVEKKWCVFWCMIIWWCFWHTCDGVMICRWRSTFHSVYIHRALSVGNQKSRWFHHTGGYFYLYTDQTFNNAFWFNRERWCLLVAQPMWVGLQAISYIDFTPFHVSKCASTQIFFEGLYPNFSGASRRIAQIVEKYKAWLHCIPSANSNTCFNGAWVTNHGWRLWFIRHLYAFLGFGRRNLFNPTSLGMVLPHYWTK